MSMTSAFTPAADLVTDTARAVYRFLEPVGDDGLTASERREVAARYEMTVGRPQRSHSRADRMRTLGAKVEPWRGGQPG